MLCFCKMAANRQWTVGDAISYWLFYSHLFFLFIHFDFMNSFFFLPLKQWCGSGWVLKQKNHCVRHEIWFFVMDFVLVPRSEHWQRVMTMMDFHLQMHHIQCEQKKKFWENVQHSVSSASIVLRLQKKILITLWWRRFILNVDSNGTKKNILYLIVTSIENHMWYDSNDSIHGIWHEFKQITREKVNCCYNRFTKP